MTAMTPDVRAICDWILSAARAIAPFTEDPSRASRWRVSGEGPPLT